MAGASERGGAVMGRPNRVSADYEMARSEGHAAYFAGLTPADGPYNELDGLLWPCWVDGWHQAQDSDQNSPSDAR